MDACGLSAPGPYPPTLMRSRRSPFRWLAPLALIVVVGTALVVVNNADIGSKGDEKTAEKLEAEMDKAARSLQRLDVQRDALAASLNDAAEVERAQTAAKLKKNADALLEQSVERFGALEPLAAALSAAERAGADKAAALTARLRAAEARAARAEGAVSRAEADARAALA